MSTELLQRLQTSINAMAADGNVDVEDVESALGAIWADGVLSPAEAQVLGEALRALSRVLEPAARRYLDDRLAGRPVALVSRLLLGPPPRGAAIDLYHPRSDVVRLQSALVALGHAVRVDGLYGGGTTRAVAELQRASSLTPTGLLDTLTLVRLNEALRSAGHPPLDLSPRARIRPDEVVALRGGSNREDNRRLQVALSAIAAARGEPQLSADGAFGAITEAAVRAAQARAYLPETGVVDRATAVAIQHELAAAGGGALELEGAPPEGKTELHFYPGDHELKVYVLREGKHIGTYGMVGGTSVGRDDPRSDVDYSPSPEGRYDVVEVSPHAAYSWSYSYVPYGADLRKVDGEVEYRDGTGAWRVATGPASVFAGRNPPPLGSNEYLDEDGKLPPTWRYNDFGHLRGRLRSQATRALQTHMIHSSADQEETAAYFADTGALLRPEEALRRLRHSHGCEHVHPRDLDDMITRGYLRPGTVFVIHGYDDRFGAA
jgi:peptidoglycan hydrolase-like protein with peptidoglycan-binding domain